MSTALAFASAHRAELALLAWLALSLLNGSLDYAHLRHGAIAKRVVGLALDRLAFLARRDSPGTLALPGAPSAAPPPPPARLAILPPAPTEPQ